MLLKEEGKCSLSCITCSNQITSGRSFRDGVVDDTPGSNKPVVIKSLTAQVVILLVLVLSRVYCCSEIDLLDFD